MKIESIYEKLWRDAEQARQVKLRGLVGQPGGVRLRLRFPPQHPSAYLNDRFGTLKAITNETLAGVNWGEDINMLLHIADLAAADEAQICWPSTTPEITQPPQG